MSNAPIYTYNRYVEYVDCRCLLVTTYLLSENLTHFLIRTSGALLAILHDIKCILFYTANNERKTNLDLVFIVTGYTEVDLPNKITIYNILY